MLHLLFALLAIGACSRGPVGESRMVAAPHDTLWLVARDPANDAVHANDSEASLRARYGSENVAQGEVDLGEGETEMGTILFPADPTRRLTVIWGDTAHRTRPELVSIDGYPTRWVVYPGVRLGTRLTSLEKLNGRAFHLFGFEFDYSGTVLDWGGGRLNQLWPRQRSGRDLVTLRLMPDSTAGAKWRDQVLGERVFSSSHPVMQALNPRVYDLFVAPR